ncbi:MAG: carboxypeptidase regulatory-like domain-containing protein, partial [Chitinophagaceae bacterium]
LDSPAVSVQTDSNGYFFFNNVRIGRHSFQFTMIGFETQTLFSIEVIAGKTKELNIELKENFHSLKEVIVKGRRTRTSPVNEFASVSTRSFSVDEMRRYSTSVADPARMVMNFPGVSSNGDNNNSLVVRGNSPKGMLWRLEGIEIPNPNHFSSLGNSGGSISMLNANTLGNSDFYTGAFVPEIGNALSGAFDLYLRNGNTNRYEHTVQLSTLGAEVATEGPFEKGKQGSYLLSYRYSTFGIIRNYINLGSSIPGYQDLSFKINLPTKKTGTFSLFGLGGLTKESKQAIADSTAWTAGNDNVSFTTKTFTGVTGISHQYFFNSRAYIKTIISASYEKTSDNVDTLNPFNFYKHKLIEKTAFLDKAIRISIFYNQKINANNSFRTGIAAQQLNYDLNYRYYDKDSAIWKNILEGAGNTWFYQGYIQWKVKFSKRITAITGIHASYFALTAKSSIEPRVSLVYAMTKTTLTFAAGLHSKPEHISTYLFQNINLGQQLTYPNKNLDLLRAFHMVAGVEKKFFHNYKFKVELYLQKLYSIPVESDTASGFSILNADNVFSLLETAKPLVSKGKGTNYGIDISMEHPLRNGYFVVATASLFKSTYTNFKNKTYNTHFNRGYQLNIIAGKEYKINKTGRQVIGLNGKLLYSGGVRESLIDINKSIITGRTEYVLGKYFTQQVPAYFRTDASMYFKFNRKKATHTLEIAVQNLTNRKNYAFSYFNIDTRTINNTTQLGLIPNLSYRIDFHW